MIALITNMKTAADDVVVFASSGGVTFQQTLDRLRQVVPFSQAMISTTLPRGGLQVIQPRQVDPAWTRAYSREYHLHDGVAWEALRQGRPTRLPEARNGNGVIVDRFVSTAMEPLELGHYAAVPLVAPLLEGFPGALQLFRKAEEADFSSEELVILGKVAEQLDAAAEKTRQLRQREHDPPPLARRLRLRQVAIGPGPRPLFPDQFGRVLDPAVRSNLLETAEKRLCSFAEEPGRGSGTGRTGDAPQTLPTVRSSTLVVPDEEADQWVFRLVMYEFFPALAGEPQTPVAVVSLPPECHAWAQLRSSDIEADVELARLIPALQYMHQNFTSGINLTEVARAVHLSPFHFHRRFSELLGTTPKQFLFDCQIAHAKHHLAKGERPLSEIAASAGFAHQSHFTSRFRQATGLTPTKWKRLASSGRPA